MVNMLPTIFRNDLGGVLDRWFDPFDLGTEVVSFPKVDIHEDKDHVYVKADLPGMKAEDIKVEVNDENVLTISGERKFEKELERKDCYRVERQYGSFERRFRLGQNVDGTNVKAEYKHGELKLTIAKKEEKKPRTITIDVKE
jgi:HSP20 family protein